MNPCCSGFQVQGTANSPAGMALFYSLHFRKETYLYSITDFFSFFKRVLKFSVKTPRDKGDRQYADLLCLFCILMRVIVRCSACSENCSDCSENYSGCSGYFACFGFACSDSDYSESCSDSDCCTAYSAPFLRRQKKIRITVEGRRNRTVNYVIALPAMRL